MIDTTGSDAELQLIKASVGRIERDYQDFNRKFDQFLLQHQQKHDADSKAFTDHVLMVTTTMGMAARHEIQIPELDRRQKEQESWRSELRGAMNLLKLTFGTSIVSGVLAVAAIVVLFTQK